MPDKTDEKLHITASSQIAINGDLTSP
jgi:hypothetical protein